MKREPTYYVYREEKNIARYLASQSAKFYLEGFSCGALLIPRPYGTRGLRSLRCRPQDYSLFFFRGLRCCS